MADPQVSDNILQAGILAFVEVLLIEAPRAAPGDDAPTGLLRGLAASCLHPRNAPRPGAHLDGGAIGQNRSAVALRLLPTLHARGWPTADGISARLADGARQGFAESPTHGHGTGRRARRLFLRKHVQYGICTLCGSATKSVCTRADADSIGSRLRSVPEDALCEIKASSGETVDVRELGKTIFPVAFPVIRGGDLMDPARMGLQILGVTRGREGQETRIH